MNKAITITLSGQVFQIEETAYEKLRSYLDKVRRALAGGSDAEEVMSDIETSIAEKFSARTSTRQVVITQADIVDLITVMGEPEVFDPGEKPERGQGWNAATSSETLTTRKLYRSSDDVIIAGVCSGLAAYFGIDSALVRLLFFISILFGGVGIVLYILLWIILPEAKSKSQKMAMQGRPVTLAAIEETVKKNLSELSSQENKESLKSFGRRLVEFPFDILRLIGRALRNIFRVIIPVIRILAGVFLFLVAAAGFAGLSFVFVAALLDINSPYLVTGLSLAELLQESTFRIGLVASYVFFLMPLLFIGQGAVSLLRKRNAFSLTSAGLMLGIFITAAVTSGLVALEYGPRIRDFAEQSQGTISRDIAVGEFSKIEASDNLRLIIRPGDVAGIAAEGTEDNLNLVRSETVDDILKISLSERTESFCIFCNHWQAVALTITAPVLDAYTGSDITRADIADFSGAQFELILSDAARLELAANYDNLHLDLSDASSLSQTGTSTLIELAMDGAARANLSGSGETMTASLSDAARLDATDLLTIDAALRLKDAARAELYVTGKLTAQLSGSSRLDYLGTATTAVGTEGSAVRFNKIGTEDDE